MNLDIIEQKIKRQSSFFKLSDGSWCEIATKWGKGPRTGLIICRGQEKAIPVLAKILINEATRRKYEKIDIYSKGIIESELHGKEKHDYTQKILRKIEEIN